MADKTGIEWTNATWNPVTGCDKVSQGCKNCYAERDWRRLVHLPTYAGRKFTDVATHPDRLDQPLRWTKPRMIFVNSMSDLFHEDVPVEFIDQVFAVMALAPRHTFQVLTKRPERMLAYFNERPQRLLDWWRKNVGAAAKGYDAPPPAKSAAASNLDRNTFALPLPNAWLGVSVEDQTTTDERIPLLLQTPAAVRWLSMEPLLGPVSLDCWPVYDEDEKPLLHWIVVGGESGPKARPMHPIWARSLRDQCQAAGVPFFFKQWGEWLPGHHYETKHALADPNPERSRFRCMDFVGDQFIEIDGSWIDNIGHDAVYRVGKKLAGRELDGRTWDEYPKVPV